MLCVVGASETGRNIGGRRQSEVHAAGAVAQDLWHHILPCQGCMLTAIKV